MKIFKLKAENIKRIKAVEINTDGKNFIEITGKNGQGKSSVLDSIAYVLGGKSLIPERPIRDGETYGMIEVTIDDFIVRRLFNQDGSSTLKITNKDGFVKTSPQQWLDSIIGTLSFDPLAFTMLEPKKRVEMFKKLAGIDTTELDKHYQELYAKRHETGILVKRAEGAVESLKEFSEPVQVPDISELQRQRDEAQGNNAFIANREAQLVRLNNDRAETSRKIYELQELLKLIDQKKSEIQAELDQISYVDLVPALTKQINEVQELVVKKAKHDSFIKAVKEFDQISTTHLSISEEIREITLEKQKIIESAKLPVQGLTLNDSELYYNGIPFEQLSQAEQLKVSMAMAIAENPQLKIARITDGSLLDSQSMQVLKEMIEAHDFQLFIETVSDENPENGALYIYDGEIAA
jgi:DNA repair exonuclease SbcCD ATPase subunit